MESRFGYENWLAVTCAMAFALSFAVRAIAAPPGLPDTKVVPAESASNSGDTPAPATGASASSAEASPSPSGSASPSTRKSAAVHHALRPSQVVVEPGQARAKLNSDTWAYSEPSKSSKHVERVHKDLFVNVTGSTHYYLRVKLKSGATAYIEQSAVDLVRPTDKIFQLTSNATVLDKPNRWGKKLAEVHRGHDVHVIGIALSYARIRMRSGLEGFIPVSAMQ